jgi:WD40 repeat protein/transcriptional regulator with XRE-family HTH domain
MGRKDKDVSPEDIAQQKIGASMRVARQNRNISLTEMARRIGCTKGLLSSIENERVTPTLAIVKQYEQILDLDEGFLVALIDEERVAQGKRRIYNLAKLPIPVARPVDHTYLAEAPSISRFYGREQEIAELSHWIQQDKCKQVSVFGIGGIGKTTLAAQLVEQFRLRSIPNDFDYIFWRSLQSLPPLERLLEDVILFISEGQSVHLPEGEDSKISMFLNLLHQHRCLLVLDNFESVLESRSTVGNYRKGYEGYARLIQRIGSSRHKSCLLLTSREKPGEIIYLEGKTSPVRSMELTGIVQPLIVESMLEGEELRGDDAAWNALIERCSGNPLALKLTSANIREIFAGDIASFLQESGAAFGGIHVLIDQQFHRLSNAEQDVMYWLAIRCEQTPLSELSQDILEPTLRKALPTVLESLRRRFMIDVPAPARFALQPVITDYVIDAFVNKVCDEIMSGKLDVFASHALIKAQARDYVREDQERQVLRPVVDYLVNELGREGAENRLRDLLALLRARRAQTAEYAAGNALNMLLYLNNAHLSDLDCSYLSLWQGYLRGATLHNVNFAHTYIQRTVFNETFKGVLSVAISPDGKLLAAGTLDGAIWLWDTANGELQSVCRDGEANWVCWSVAFSPDGTILAGGSEDWHIRLWSVQRGELLTTLRGHTSWVYSVAFSADGSLLASGSHDRTIRLWDVANVAKAECVQVLDLEKTCVDSEKTRVKAVRFSPSGTLLASGSEDGTIRLWDTSSLAPDQKPLKEWHADNGTVFSLRFSPDGRILASGGEDRIVYLWDVESGKRISSFKGHTDRILSIAFSREGDMLASGSEDQTIRLWRVKNGECFRVLQDHNDRVWSVMFSPVEDTLVSGGIDHTIHFWDVSQGRCLKIRTLQGYANSIRSVAFNAQGELLAGGSDDHSIYLWPVDQKQHVNGLRKRLYGHTNLIWSVSFSPTAEVLVSGGDDKVIRLWDVKKGELVQEFVGHSTWVRSISFSPDGKLLASSSVGKTIRIWDVEWGKYLYTLRGHANRVKSVAFSPDGNLLASASDDHTIRLWKINAVRGELDKILEGHEKHVWTVAFSPDGKLLASGGDDGTIRLWRVSTRQCIKVLKVDVDWVGSVAFSPDSMLLASGNSDKTVRLWDISSGRSERNVLRGHTDVVYAVAFSPDGRQLASGSADGAVKIWDVSSGEVLQTLQGERPYEHMNINHAQGLHASQVDMLKTLGAIL